MLISVIVPIYKVEKYLKKCIDSIINQTYKDLEIILVDDGSSDKCPEICDEYAKNDDRIIVIHKENGGLSSARNAGLDIMKGQYVFFVDSDDFIDKTTIEKSYKALIENDADMSVFGYDFINEQGNKLENFISPIVNGIMNAEQFVGKCCGEKFYYYSVAWNKLYKSFLFDEIRFPVGKINEDVFIAHKIAYLCKKIVLLEDNLYYYLVRNNSISRSNNSIKNLDNIEGLADRCVFIYDHNLFGVINTAFAFYRNRYYELRYELQRDKAAKKYLKKFDKLFKSVFKHCRSALNFKTRIIGRFPRVVWRLVKIKNKFFK